MSICVGSSSKRGAILSSCVATPVRGCAFAAAEVDTGEDEVETQRRETVRRLDIRLCRVQLHCRSTLDATPRVNISKLANYLQIVQTYCHVWLSNIAAIMKPKDHLIMLSPDKRRKHLDTPRPRGAYAMRNLLPLHLRAVGSSSPCRSTGWYDVALDATRRTYNLILAKLP